MLVSHCLLKVIRYVLLKHLTHFYFSLNALQKGFVTAFNNKDLILFHNFQVILM